MIKLKEIVESLDHPLPHYLYHGTFKALLPNIEKKGLIPGGENFRNYEDIAWGVYLSNDYDVAGSMVETSDNENIPEQWFDEIIILVIDITNLDQTKFDLDPQIVRWQDESIHSYIYRGKIPATAITEILNYT